MNLLLKSQDLDAWVRPRIRFDVEELWAVALSSRLEVIDAEMIFRGSASECAVHPREIFRFAILKNAVHLAVVHSHPSGDFRPSESDVRITQNLYVIGRLLKIPLVDHLVMSQDGYQSMSDEGYFRRWSRKKSRFY